MEDHLRSNAGSQHFFPPASVSPPSPTSPRTFPFESLEDCPLNEDEDAFQGLREEDEETDQFNEDTFRPVALDYDWQEAHERLAQLEEKLPVAVNNKQVLEKGTRWVPKKGDHQENLAERLNKMVIENEH